MMNTKRLAVLTPFVLSVSPCLAQQALTQAGSASLPEGQYMLSNLQTGKASFVVVDNSGRLFTQDLQQVKISVSPTTRTGSSETDSSSSASSPPPVAPAPTQTQSQTQPPAAGGLGSLIKQGLQDVEKSQAAGQGASTAPASSQTGGFGNMLEQGLEGALKNRMQQTK